MVTHLLERHQNGSSASSTKAIDPIPHIRGLRDITQLKLTPNTLYRPPSPTRSSNEYSVYPFMCPLSSKQMDGQQRFIYIIDCGCVMSATGLRTTVAAAKPSQPIPNRPEHKPCPVCGKAFNAAGLAKGKQPEVGGSVVTINPSDAEEAEMRAAMENARAEQTKKKKAKTRTADQAIESGGLDSGHAKEDQAEQKRRKAERKSEMRARLAALTAELTAEQ